MLVGERHDVLSALEVDQKATDREIMALAMEEDRILITEDKDFGELVFVRGLPHPCIVRFVEMPVSEKVEAMRELIEARPNAMRDGSLIVVTRNRVRIRSRENLERGEE